MVFKIAARIAGVFIGIILAFFMIVGIVVTYYVFDECTGFDGTVIFGNKEYPVFKPIDSRCLNTV